MKYKNIEIVNIVKFLDGISEKKLPQKISYAIMRISRKNIITMNMH